MSAYHPWSGLVPGQLFGVKSQSGNAYELTLIHAGTEETGLIARRSTGKLARFYPERLDWRTLESGMVGPVLIAGDEVLLTLRGGPECRVHVVQADAERISYRTPTGEYGVASAERTVKGSVRLLFAATDWRTGDEFLIRSLSGRDYRGTTLRVASDKIEVRLAGPDVGGGMVALRVANTEIRTLRVLVPVKMATLASV